MEREVANKNVPIGEAIQFGWNTFKANPLFLVGVFIAASVITGVVESAGEVMDPDDGFLGFLIAIVGLIVTFVFEMGIIAIALKLHDGEMPEFGDLFNRVGLVLQYGAAAIIYFVMVVFGLILLIIPGIYLSVRFHFFGYFIVDQEVGPIEALERSSKLTEGVRLELFLFGMLLIGINIAGLLCFIVGIFVSMPVTSLAMAYVFRHLQGPPAVAQPDVTAQAA